VGVTLPSDVMSQVATTDLLKLTQTEGQVWLSLYNLSVGACY
jgi:hypothetical protein